MNFIELPKLRLQILFVALAFVTFIALFYHFDTSFPWFSDNTKYKLTQFGICVLSLSALQAGLSFLWGRKVWHNLQLSNAHIEEHQRYSSQINDVNNQLGGKLEPQVSEKNKQYDRAKDELSIAEGMHNFYEKCGLVSIILLVIGSGCCIVGAG